MKEIWQEHWQEVIDMIGILGTNFRLTVKNSFRKLKVDISSLKENIGEWIMFLDSNQRDLQLKVRDLEKKIEYLERFQYAKR